MYCSAASVGTVRIAPDIIVRMPSRALRVLRIVLSVRFSRPMCGSRPRSNEPHPRFEGSLSVLVGRHGAMNPAGRVRCNMRKEIELGRDDCNFTRVKRTLRTPLEP